jgi:hypothetical protein
MTTPNTIPPSKAGRVEHFAFDIGDRVMIKEIQRPGRVMALIIDFEGDKHCSFVADAEYNLGPFKVGELRKLADAGIAAEKKKERQ